MNPIAPMSEADATEQVQWPVAVAPHERDAEQVEEAAQVALGPVAGSSVLPRAVVHRDLRDPVSAVRREHRDEAVQLPVQTHALQHLGAVGLQSAVDVVQADTRDRRRSSS